MARVLTKKVLEEIRFRNDIVQVVESYLHLQRAGSSFKALCPFHKEKTPSFHVHPQRQSFHCFGCGAGGDVFRFVMRQEGVDFMTAVRLLAQRAGMALEFEEAAGTGADGADKTAWYRLHADVAALYRRLLAEAPEAAAARAYLDRRGLTPEVVDAFQIGYAPDRWDTLLEWARQHQTRLEDLETCGLLVRREEADGTDRPLYDRFRHRLMFPIQDEQGRIIGFSGRALQEDAKTAKYVNSPETPLFKKSRVLYALDKARRAIAEQREALVCEGQIDVIRCHQAGFPTAVAAQGTAFTDEHVRILKRYADSVCLVFDADTAGRTAAVRTAQLFLEAGLAVRVASLPPGEDPDSYLRRHGPEPFRRLLNCAVSAVQFQIETLAAGEDLKSEVGVMRAARAVLGTIARSPQAVQRARLLQEAARLLNLPVSALADDLRRLLRQTAARAAAAEEPALPPPPERPREELALCEHLAQIQDYPQLGPLLRRYLPPELLTDPACRRVAEAALRSLEEGRDLHELLREDDDAEGSLQRFAAELQAAPAKARGREFSPEEAVKDLILALWRRRLERERAALEQDGGEAHERRRREITHQLHYLRRWQDGAAIIEVELAGVREA